MRVVLAVCVMLCGVSCVSQATILTNPASASVLELNETKASIRRVFPRLSRWRKLLHADGMSVFQSSFSEARHVWEITDGVHQYRVNSSGTVLECEPLHQRVGWSASLMYLGKTGRFEFPNGRAFVVPKNYSISSSDPYSGILLLQNSRGEFYFYSPSISKPQLLGSFGHDALATAIYQLDKDLILVIDGEGFASALSHILVRQKGQWSEVCTPFWLMTLGRSLPLKCGNFLLVGECEWSQGDELTAIAISAKGPTLKVAGNADRHSVVRVFKGNLYVRRAQKWVLVQWKRNRVLA